MTFHFCSKAQQWLTRPCHSSCSGDKHHRQEMDEERVAILMTAATMARLRIEDGDIAGAHEALNIGCVSV